jgi:hypothetical protein
VLVVPFCLAYYGKERANYFNPQEVAASEWLYSHAPARSLLVGADAQLPWGFTHYENYDYLFLENLTPSQRATLAKSPMTEIDQESRSQAGPTYVILTRSQADYARYTGILSSATMTALTSSLQHDPFYRVVYRNADAVIFFRPHSPRGPGQ